MFEPKKPLIKDEVWLFSQREVSMESTHLIEEPGEDAELGEGDIRPLQEEEKRLLSRALKATRGNVRRAAKLLGIGRATLYRKIQIYDLRLN